MATGVVGTIQFHRSRRSTGVALLIVYLALYAATLFIMVRRGHFDPSEALGVGAVLGIGFSLCAWVLTFGVKPLPCIVLQPAPELAILAAYLLPLTVFVTWGFDAVRRLVLADPAQAVAILLVKLALFVAIPWWIMRKRFGYSWTTLAPASAGTSHMLVVVLMAFLLLVFQSFVGRGMHDIVAAHISSSTLVWGIPVAFIWLALEAGVVEEFFFRALVQSRLSAALRSELGGIVIMALLFGLMHAPGLYLRTSVMQEGIGPNPPLFMAIGYSIVITSVAGFFLGVLWARTRNFAVVVLVHAATDLLPDLLPTLRSLHLLR